MNKEYLLCPQCQETRFNPLTTGMVLKDEVDFIKPVKLIEPQQILICVNCGYTMNEHEGMKRQMVMIITGDSESYKRKAVITAGFADILNKHGGRWDKTFFIKQAGVVFVTKGTVKQGVPDYLRKILFDSVVHEIDCSGGDYTELLKFKSQQW